VQPHRGMNVIRHGSDGQDTAPEPIAPRLEARVEVLADRRHDEGEVKRCAVGETLPGGTSPGDVAG
jgi:hypothetical protein